MRVLTGLLAVLLSAAAAGAHPPAHGDPPPADIRPQHQKDWETAMVRSLTINPQPWEMVWPKAWIPLVQDGEPPMTTAEVHQAITTVAWRAYGNLNLEVLRLEQQERDDQAACVEAVTKDPEAESTCAVPCRGACPAGLTAAERKAQDRRARIEMARRKMGTLEELAHHSQAMLRWKREQGEDVNKRPR